MSSLVISAADAVTSILNGRTFGTVTVSAVRKLVVERSLTNSRQLLCICVPHKLESTVISRGRATERTVTVDVGLMQRCAESDLENLIKLTEEIGSFLEGAQSLNGRCIGVEYAPIYDTEIFLQQSCFFSLISVNIKVFNG